MQLMQFLKITFWDLASETSIQNNFLSFVDNVSMKNSQVFDPKTIWQHCFKIHIDFREISAELWESDIDLQPIFLHMNFLNQSINLKFVLVQRYVLCDH